MRIITFILRGILNIINESCYQETSFLLNERFGSFFFSYRAVRFSINRAQNKKLSLVNMRLSAEKSAIYFER